VKPLPLIALCSECKGPMPCACVRELGWAPKTMKRWRCGAYLKFVRRLPCAVPECRGGPVEAAHFGPRGVGQKVHDSLAIPLCRRHHMESHQAGRTWEHYGEVLGWQAQTMVAALASDLHF
jgi:hypothetical protein